MTMRVTWDAVGRGGERGLADQMEEKRTRVTRVGLGDGVNGERSDGGDGEVVLLGERSHDRRGGGEGLRRRGGKRCDGVSSGDSGKTSMTPPLVETQQRSILG